MTLALSADEGRGLAAMRRMKAFAGPDQLRLLLGAAVVFLFVDFVRLTLQAHGADPLGSAMDGLTYVALLAMLWRPRLGLLLASVPLVVAVFWPGSGLLPVLLVAVGALGGAQLLRRELVWLTGAMAGWLALGVLLHGQVGRVPFALTLGAAAALGLAVGWSLLVARERQERSDAAAARRASESARIRADERAAIARELHDVVVHNLSTVSLQVMGARGSQDAEHLRGVLECVEGANAEAITDLRLLMRVLRDESLEASPGVELQELTQRVPPTLRAASAELALVRAGFEPDVMVPAATDQLAMTVQNTISRVVEEAVENVVRHAPARSRCVVRVTLTDQQASVQVRNPVPEGTRVSLGWGLRRLQERIQLTGGECRVTVAGGEWVVSATLPLS